MSRLIKALFFVLFFSGFIPLQATACPAHENGHCTKNCDQASGECYCEAPKPA